MTLFNAQKEKREEGFIKDFLQIRNLGSPGKKSFCFTSFYFHLRISNV